MTTDSYRLTEVRDEEHIAPGRYLIRVEFLDPWATFTKDGNPDGDFCVGAQLEPQAAVDLAMRLIVAAQAPDLSDHQGRCVVCEARCPDCRGEASIYAIIDMMWAGTEYEPLADRLCDPHAQILQHHWKEFPGASQVRSRS